MYAGGFNLEQAREMLTQPDVRRTHSYSKLEGLSAYARESLGNGSESTLDDALNLTILIADVESRHYRNRKTVARASALVEELKGYRSKVLSDFGVSVNGTGETHTGHRGRLTEELDNVASGLGALDTTALDQSYFDNFYRLVHGAQRKAKSLRKKEDMRQAENIDRVVGRSGERVRRYLAECIASKMADYYRQEAEAAKSAGKSKDQAIVEMRRNLSPGIPRFFEDTYDNNSVRYILENTAKRAIESVYVPNEPARSQSSQVWPSRAVPNVVPNDGSDTDYIGDVHERVTNRWLVAKHSARDFVSREYSALSERVRGAKKVFSNNYFRGAVAAGILAAGILVSFPNRQGNAVQESEYGKPAVVQHVQRTEQPKQAPQHGDAGFMVYNVGRGVTIWGIEKEQLGRKFGRKPRNAEVYRGVEKVLGDNHLSWDDARHLRVGQEIKLRV